MSAPVRQTRLLVVRGCHSCPNSSDEHTPGSGFGRDYYCMASRPPRIYVGYVEWDREKRADGDFPDWCPLHENDGLIPTDTR